MFLVTLIGWLRLRVTPVEEVTVVHRPSAELKILKDAVVSKWPKSGWHFAYAVEKNPGDKWIPEEYEEEHVLGVFRSSEAVLNKLDTLTARLVKERTMQSDRYIDPDWICILIL